MHKHCRQGSGTLLLLEMNEGTPPLLNRKPLVVPKMQCHAIPWFVQYRWLPQSHLLTAAFDRYRTHNMWQDQETMWDGLFAHYKMTEGCMSRMVSIFGLTRF